MSLSGLCSIHEVAFRPLKDTEDGAMSVVTTIGGAKKRTTARVIPMQHREKRMYEADDIQVTHKVIFSEDPVYADEDHVLVYDCQVFRFVEMIEPHNMNRFWKTIWRRDEALEDATVD